MCKNTVQQSTPAKLNSLHYLHLIAPGKMERSIRYVFRIFLFYRLHSRLPNSRQTLYWELWYTTPILKQMKEKVGNKQTSRGKNWYWNKNWKLWRMIQMQWQDKKVTFERWWYLDLSFDDSNFIPLVTIVNHCEPSQNTINTTP